MKYFTVSVSYFSHDCIYIKIYDYKFSGIVRTLWTGSFKYESDTFNTWFLISESIKWITNKYKVPNKSLQIWVLFSARWCFGWKYIYDIRFRYTLNKVHIYVWKNAFFYFIGYGWIRIMRNILEAENIEMEVRYTLSAAEMAYVYFPV